MKKSLAVAVICGIACALCVFAFVQSVQAEADESRKEALDRYGGEQIEVCVATKDIVAGEKPTAANTTVKLWVTDLLPSDPVTSLSEVANKQVSTSIVAGEVLSMRHFDSSVALVEVPEGKCALSVPTDEVQAIGGAIQAGMSVDVYLAGSSSISLLSQNTLVLATSAGDGGSSSSSKISWVTLAVDPSRVQEFIRASEAGNLYFVLSNQKSGGSTSSASSSSSASSAASSASSSGASVAASSSSSSGASSNAEGNAPDGSSSEDEGSGGGASYDDGASYDNGGYEPEWSYETGDFYEGEEE